MKSHHKNIKVSKEDLDILQHVNNVRYVQWVQDIAEEHWELAATPEMKTQYFWVMINHCIEYKGEARLDDVVELKTYVDRSEGVTSTRIVEMYLQRTGKLIVRSETNWCLLSMLSKRPSRISQEMTAIFQ